MRNITSMIVLVLMLLSGCASDPITVVSDPKRIIHPELPAPIDPYKFDWKVVVLEDGKTVIVGLDYDESVDFKIFLEDIKRYIKQSNTILCSYRRDLNEPQCTPIKK